MNRNDLVNRSNVLKRSAVAATLIAATVLALLLVPDRAHAVPAYARRYNTSCATCHVSFPRLSPFGEAFYRNGYAYPGDDIDQVRDEPVVLGAEAYRSMFPEAIWPGDMPYNMPISAVLHTWISAENRDGDDPLVSFDNLGAMGDVLIAGSLGESIGFFGKFGIGDARASQPQHQRFHVTLRNIWPNSYVRVGRFAPELFRVPQTSCNSCHFAMSRPVGDNRWRVEGPDNGIEIAGSIAGRVRYAAGVVEGVGSLRNTPKNYYARIGFKIGGLRLDGVSEDGAPSEPWVDNSVELGGFGYFGNASLSATNQVGETIDFDDRFLVGGVDLNVTFGDFALYGVAIGEWHEQPTPEDREILVERYLGEVRYVVWPWLIPSLTFEYFNTQLDSDFQWQGRAALEMLYRANVKFTVDVAVRRPGRDQTRFQEARLLLEMGI